MSAGDVKGPFTGTAGTFVCECDLPVAKEEQFLGVLTARLSGMLGVSLYRTC